MVPAGGESSCFPSVRGVLSLEFKAYLWIGGGQAYPFLLFLEQTSVGTNHVGHGPVSSSKCSHPSLGWEPLQGPACPVRFFLRWLLYLRCSSRPGVCGWGRGAAESCSQAPHEAKKDHGTRYPSGPRTPETAVGPSPTCNSISHQDNLKKRWGGKFRYKAVFKHLFI